MKSIQNQMTVEIPSTFGMPVRAHAFAAKACSWTTAAVSTIARDRGVATLVTGAFPGNSAWRPPNC